MLSSASAAVFPNLVIYHKLRDFGHGPRDKILLLVRSHESPKVRDFGKFPRKMGKSHYFCPKNTKSFHSKIFQEKICEFPVILRSIPRDNHDFFGCFFARDFRDFFALKSGFSRKIIWEHWEHSTLDRIRYKRCSMFHIRSE